jgi:hypothetical protein
VRHSFVDNLIIQQQQSIIISHMSNFACGQHKMIFSPIAKNKNKNNVFNFHWLLGKFQVTINLEKKTFM